MQIHMSCHADTREETVKIETISIRKIQQDEEENEKK
jgi:hypothetical protein